MSQFFRGLRGVGAAGHSRITDENVARGMMQGARKAPVKAAAGAGAAVVGRRRILGDVTNRGTQQQRATKPAPSYGVGNPSGQFQVYRDATTEQKPKRAIRATASSAVPRVAGTHQSAGIGQRNTVDQPRFVKKEQQNAKEKMEERNLLLQMTEMRIADVDKPDVDDPQAVVEYIADIFDHVKNNEVKYLPKDYMKQQRNISTRMRAILIDWLVHVHLKFRLRTDTLFLTVNYVDRYLSSKEVSREELQLVGITAMLVASKYEETYVPLVRDFRHMSDGTYTRGQILSAEREFLATLKFNLTVPTPYLFARRYAKVAPADPETNMIIKFVLELALVDYSMLQFRPSMQAAAATYVGRREGGLEIWPTELVEHTGYTMQEVEDCVVVLDAVILKSRTSKLTGVRSKYSHKAFHQVAMRL